ncbi:hypothetical protein KP509_08G051100 [Ceratopteris richardii]|uniref:Uncharacterized protein n=1 Tax=Ceratopteris richardii TaxID=49495 RepID=A0A8T2U9W4_CERRI|nr:hypothetical protein KP509_08G051100 [Ceratopteris richardii]
MGSENVANGAAADVDVDSTESNLYQGGAIDNGAEMNVEKSNAHEAKARFVDEPNAEVESGWVLASSAEGNGSGWISADGAPVTLPPAVASQPWPSSQQRSFYLVRIPRSVDEKLRNEIKLAEARVEHLPREVDRALQSIERGFFNEL